MPSSNQKRITELEAQLKESQAKVTELEAEKIQLTTYLNHIAKASDRVSAADLQLVAREGTDLSGALKQLQKRDLTVAYMTVARMKFPVDVRKSWSGEEVQGWIQKFAEVLQRRALAQAETGKEAAH